MLQVARLTTRRTGFMLSLIAAMLFANLVLSAHQSDHATLLHDDCEIAQLAQNTTATSLDHQELLYTEFVNFLEVTNSLEHTPPQAFVAFPSRAPPVHIV